MPATWKESRELPYLDACIKEAGRVHPPFGLPLERIVPEGGLSISGEFIPAGTIVGMNGWVVHRDRDVFGDDADQWRPERWLEADESTKARMDQGLLTVREIFTPPRNCWLCADVYVIAQFGGGHRSCLGKNISLLELYKLVPTILRTYEVGQPEKRGLMHLPQRHLANHMCSSSSWTAISLGGWRIVGLSHNLALR